MVNRWSAVVFLLVVGVMFAQHLRTTSALEPGQKAPALSIKLTDGTLQPLPDAGGDVVVLNFWASWCGPCRHEAPVLSAAHFQGLGHGAKVLGVSLDAESNEKGRAAADRLGMRFPVALPTRQILGAFAVDRLPTTYVIARDGTITHTTVGAIGRAELDAAIAEAKRR